MWIQEEWQIISIMYIPCSKLHVLVNEVKKDKDQPVESQHNLQMVGLFSKVQRTMLGLEVKPGTIHPLRGDEVLYNIDTGCSFDVSKTSDLLRLIDCLIFFCFMLKLRSDYVESFLCFMLKLKSDHVGYHC